MAASTTLERELGYGGFSKSIFYMVLQAKYGFVFNSLGYIALNVIKTLLYIVYIAIFP